MLISSMVPPEASACMLWGGMSSCAQHHSNNGLERLVLRSAPHVFRRGRYVDNPAIMIAIVRVTFKLQAFQGSRTCFLWS